MAQPVTKPVTNENARFRLACFTIFDMAFDFTNLKNKLQFLAYGQEVCPKTGKDHFQCFGYAKDAQRWSWWQKLLKPHHFEQCIGTLDQNQTYCSKEGKYQEFGTKPMGNGHKRSLAETCEAIAEGVKQGQAIDEIIAPLPEAYPVYAQYKSGMHALHSLLVTNKLRNVDRDYAPEVIYVWGPPGSGKDRYVRDHEFNTYGREVYDCPAADGYKWKDGYSGQDAVLYANVTPADIKNPSQLLKEIDRYFIQVPIKGGYIGWRPRRIYFTSVYPLDLFADTTGFSKPLEFTRRVTKVLDVTSI